MKIIEDFHEMIKQTLNNEHENIMDGVYEAPDSLGQAIEEGNKYFDALCVI